MGQSFGGWGVKREVNGIQGMVRLGVTVMNNEPGASISISKDGTETAALRFSESGAQLQLSAEGNKMIGLATATPPQEYDLSLSDGVSGTAKYSIDQFGYVHLRGRVVGVSDLNTAFACLPEGYRPPTAIAKIVGQSKSGNDIGAARLEISAAGEIRISSTTNASTLSDWLDIGCSF